MVSCQKGPFGRMPSNNKIKNKMAPVCIVAGDDLASNGPYQSAVKVCPITNIFIFNARRVNYVQQCKAKKHSSGAS